MKIDCVGCLHGHYPQLEGGDLLIVTGDLTKSDNIQQNLEFFRWFNDQKYLKKILIAGNHDNHLVGPWSGGTKGPFREDKTFYDFDYLLDSGTTIYFDEQNPKHPTKEPFKKLKIWGSPWTLTFRDMNPHCKAFTVDTEEELAEKWKLIPDDIDILITHGPPYGIFDKIDRVTKWGTKTLDVGSLTLRHEVMNRIKPKLHVFSHIHEHGGKVLDAVVTKFANCSIMNEKYQPVNKPITISL